MALPNADSLRKNYGVKIILWLTWVTFAVGTQWSALGVGVRLGEGRRRPRSAIGDEERERETRWVQNGTERVNGVLFDCLTMYTGMSYILWASRCPCGTYKVGQWLCAPSDSELGTRNSEFGTRSSSR